VFDEVRLEVNIGQYLDVLGGAHADPGGAVGPGGPGAEGGPAGEDPAITRARRICLYKTAKYTVERPLQLGATLTDSDAGIELAGALSRVGLPLGEAFQLRDDLLGVFGDPAVTGKPVGDDLREGKPTLLAALAAATARRDGSTLLDRRLGAPDLSDDEVEAMQELIVATGARARVEASIAGLLSDALGALRSVAMRPEARDALEELALFVVDRDR
jgi:geranylgeranyl diphosphate synthase type I